MTIEEREHVTDGGPCWCNPVTEYYGMEEDGVRMESEVIWHDPACCRTGLDVDAGRER